MLQTLLRSDFCGPSSREFTSLARAYMRDAQLLILAEATKVAARHTVLRTGLGSPPQVSILASTGE